MVLEHFQCSLNGQFLLRRRVLLVRTTATEVLLAVPVESDVPVVAVFIAFEGGHDEAAGVGVALNR